MFGIHDGDGWLRTKCCTGDCSFTSVKEAARYARGRNLPEDITRISWKSYHQEWYGLKAGSEWLTDNSCEPFTFQTVKQAQSHVMGLPHLAEFRATPIKEFSVMLNEVPRESPAMRIDTSGVDTKFDDVNKPAHYNFSDLQPIDAIGAWGLSFCLGNCIKYIARHKHKNGIEDLKKAQWYLNREIASYEGKQMP